MQVRTEQRVGRSNKWEIEVGEEGGPEGSEEVGLMLSSDQPTIVRKDTKDAFQVRAAAPRIRCQSPPRALGTRGPHCARARMQWRVRNVPWPLDTYQITAEPEANEVVIRCAPGRDASRAPWIPRKQGCGRFFVRAVAQGPRGAGGSAGPSEILGVKRRTQRRAPGRARRADPRLFF